mgnify:CR=1 FL=1
MRKPNGFGSIKKLSGNRRRPYVFVISDNGHQRPVEYFCTQIEAEIFQADYNRAHQKSLPGHKATFAEIYHRWLVFHIEYHQPAESTIAGYYNAYQHCTIIHHLPLLEIKYSHLQSIIDQMRRNGLSYSSCKKVRSLVSLVSNHAIKIEEASHNYAPLLNIGRNKPIRPHKPFTRFRINRLWAISDFPYADTVLILLYTGMRCGELLALDKRNVNLRQRCLRITKSKTAAGIRTIPIHDRILPFIAARMATPGQALIADQTGAALTYPQYRARWDRVMEEIKGNHTTHDCRHTVATLLDNLGANENAKRHLLGHATGDVTDRVYTHKGLRQLRRAIQLLP